MTAYTFKGVAPTQAARIIGYMRAAGYPARKVARGSLVLGSPAVLSAMAALAVEEKRQHGQN